jgi:hypothetical protein
MGFPVMLNFVQDRTSGQIYLGQRALGAALAGMFGLLFIAFVAIMLNGMYQYFQAVSGDILRGDQLEQLGRALKVPWLLGLAVMALCDFAAALVLLFIK